MEKTVDNLVYLLEDVVKNKTLATVIAWIVVLTVAIVVGSFMLPVMAMVFIPLVMLVAALSIIVFIIAIVKYVFNRLKKHSCKED